MVSRAIALFGTEQANPPHADAPRRLAVGGVRRWARCAICVSAASRCCAPSPFSCATRTGEPSRRISRTFSFEERADGFSRDLPRNLLGRHAHSGLRRQDHRQERRLAVVRGGGRAADRRADQPHRLHRPSSGGGRVRPSGQGAACRRARGDFDLSRNHRSAMPVQATFARCRTRSPRAWWRPARWKATPSKWRTSATGPTHPTRPMCGRCTRPWPYTLPKGEKFAQSVTLSISGNAAGERRRDSGPSGRTDARQRDRQAAGDRSRRSGRRGRACAGSARSDEAAGRAVAHLRDRSAQGSWPRGNGTLPGACRSDRRGRHARDHNQRQPRPGRRTVGRWRVRRPAPA